MLFLSSISRVILTFFKVGVTTASVNPELVFLINITPLINSNLCNIMVIKSHIYARQCSVMSFHEMAPGGFVRVQMLLFPPQRNSHLFFLKEMLMFIKHNHCILLDDTQKAAEWRRRGFSRGSVCGLRGIYLLKLLFIKSLVPSCHKETLRSLINEVELSWIKDKSLCNMPVNNTDDFMKAVRLVFCHQIFIGIQIMHLWQIISIVNT